jgi:hypothetical protein
MKRLGLLAACALVISGCGTDELARTPTTSPAPTASPTDQATESPSGSPTASPTGGAPDELVGTYNVTLERSDIADPALRFNAGRWVVEFRANGNFAATLVREDFGVQGRYRVEEDRVYFADRVCGFEPEGVYAWSSDDETLVMTIIDEHCPHRALVFTTHPLERVV